ncbi:unnamed protein product, partial [Schistocephalus solidus]|uniref:F-box domain-containing protein n=1 Tax=Schistocephalus solidus TaxID=70667 RepID=A0A183T6C6_SCHSO
PPGERSTSCSLFDGRGDEDTAKTKASPSPTQPTQLVPTPTPPSATSVRSVGAGSRWRRSSDNFGYGAFESGFVSDSENMVTVKTAVCTRGHHSGSTLGRMRTHSFPSTLLATHLCLRLVIFVPAILSISRSRSGGKGFAPCERAMSSQTRSSRRLAAEVQTHARVRVALATVCKRACSGASCAATIQSRLSTLCSPRFLSPESPLSRSPARQIFTGNANNNVNLATPVDQPSVDYCPPPQSPVCLDPAIVQGHLRFTHWHVCPSYINPPPPSPLYSSSRPGNQELAPVGHLDQPLPPPQFTSSPARRSASEALSLILDEVGSRGGVGLADRQHAVPASPPFSVKYAWETTFSLLSQEVDEDEEDSAVVSPRAFSPPSTSSQLFEHGGESDQFLSKKDRRMSKSLPNFSQRENASISSGSPGFLGSPLKDHSDSSKLLISTEQRSAIMPALYSAFRPFNTSSSACDCFSEGDEDELSDLSSDKSQSANLSELAAVLRLPPIAMKAIQEIFHEGTEVHHWLSKLEDSLYQPPPPITCSEQALSHAYCRVQHDIPRRELDKCLSELEFYHQKLDDWREELNNLMTSQRERFERLSRNNQKLGTFLLSGHSSLYFVSDWLDMLILRRTAVERELKCQLRWLDLMNLAEHDVRVQLREMTELARPVLKESHRLIFELLCRQKEAQQTMMGWRSAPREPQTGSSRGGNGGLRRRRSASLPLLAGETASSSTLLSTAPPHSLRKQLKDIAGHLRTTSKGFKHVSRRPTHELSVTALDPAPLPAWRRRKWGQLKTWRDTVRQDMEGVVGPSVFCVRRWLLPRIITRGETQSVTSYCSHNKHKYKRIKFLFQRSSRLLNCFLRLRLSTLSAMAVLESACLIGAQAQLCRPQCSDDRGQQQHPPLPKYASEPSADIHEESERIRRQMSDAMLGLCQALLNRNPLNSRHRIREHSSPPSSRAFSTTVSSNHPVVACSPPILNRGSRCWRPRRSILLCCLLFLLPLICFFCSRHLADHTCHDHSLFSGLASSFSFPLPPPQGPRLI